MKKTRANKVSEDLRSEYRFDYRKARPNRFAARMDKTNTIVVLDSDVAEVFTTSEDVNTVLRALIETMPKRSKTKLRKLVPQS
jgi:hypothetical protein